MFKNLLQLSVSFWFLRYFATCSSPLAYANKYACICLPTRASQKLLSVAGCSGKSISGCFPQHIKSFKQFCPAPDSVAWAVLTFKTFTNLSLILLSCPRAQTRFLYSLSKNWRTCMASWICTVTGSGDFHDDLDYFQKCHCPSYEGLGHHIQPFALVCPAHPIFSQHHTS